MDIAAALTASLAFFVVAVSPGPANISNAAIAMGRGRSASLRYGAGLSSGLVVWGLVAASGMGAVLQASVYLLMAMKVAGGAYLLWLAWKSARSAAAPDTHADQVRSDGKWFLRGLILNLSNPKSVIAWMAALSVGLRPEDGWAAVALVTGLCIVAAFLNNLLHTALFSLPGVMAAYARARRWIDGVVAGLFALAGVGLIRSAFAR